MKDVTERDRHKAIIAAAMAAICGTVLLAYQYLNNWFKNISEILILDAIGILFIFGSIIYTLDILDKIFNGNNKPLYYAGILAIVVGPPAIIYDYFFLYNKEQGVSEFCVISAMLIGILFVSLYVSFSLIQLLINLAKFSYSYVSDSGYRNNYNRDLTEGFSAIYFLGSIIIRVIFRLTILILIIVYLFSHFTATHLLLAIIAIILLMILFRL